MNRIKRLIVSLMVAIIVLGSVAAFVTPLSAGASNASKTTAVMSPTTRAGNASTAAVTSPKAAVNNASTAAAKTTPVVGAGTWNIQTVDSAGSVGEDTSLQLTPAGWPAISYIDSTNSALKYAYKSAS